MSRSTGEEDIEQSCKQRLFEITLSDVRPSCHCSCVHLESLSEQLCAWKADNCVTGKENCISSKSSKDLGVPLTKRAKRRYCSGEKLPKSHLQSWSIPSLSSRDPYDYRGSEICALTSQEQGSFYRHFRHRNTEETFKKHDPVQNVIDRRLKKEPKISFVSPQVTTHGQGLRIVPVCEKSKTYSDQGQRKRQSVPKGPTAKQGWAYSFKNCKYPSKTATTADYKKHSKDKVKQYLVQRGVRMLQYRPEVRGLRGSSLLYDQEEDISYCSKTSLQSTHGESNLSNHLHCFSLEPKVERGQTVVNKEEQLKPKLSKKKEKLYVNSRLFMPSLSSNAPGSNVVFNSGHPTNLLQHRYQVPFSGAKCGFRYETLCVEGYERNSQPLMVVGPWIPPTSSF